ncbi:MAG: hypothetical protein HFJ12_00240 [Bacilli bacterium]|nr:hypothetical protein [Bacilli bacterium]
MTEEMMIENFKKQHLETYKKAVIEIIKNNTNSLIEKDIFSLIEKPPLDSMDQIKSKLLEVAKKQKIVLDTNGLEQFVNQFRSSLQQNFLNLEEIRKSHLILKVESFDPERETEIISITTKDLTKANQNLKKEIKHQVKEVISSLENHIDSIYKEGTLLDAKKNMNTQFLKYMRGIYQKNLLDHISMKILIKDRTLSSGVNEQGERYLFTKMNSHLFDGEKS